MNLYDIDILNMLVGESTDSETMRYAKVVLETENTPVRNNLQKSLLKSVEDKSDFDFGTIPDSKGDIKEWDRYAMILNIIAVFESMLKDESNPMVKARIDIIKSAIVNISLLKPNYAKGFLNKSNYVMTEYNVMVETCCQAITSILCDYVEVDIDIISGSYKMELTRTPKSKNGEFYFVNLEKFNKLMKTSGMEYRKMLDSISQSDRNNFTGVEIIGFATVASIIFSIIPITRELVYYFYKFRSSLSDSLEMQAKFLEMNKSCVEANETFDVVKKKKIIEKQEKLSKTLHNLSSKIRVNMVKAGRESKKEIDKDNKAFSIDSIRKDISNSDIELM